MYEDSYAGDPLDKARNFFEEGLYGHATQLLEDYLQEEPESYEGRLFLADCFYESRDLDKAADHYLQCLRQEPSDVEPWLRLGLIYSQQGKPQKALDHFIEAARIYPSCDRAYSYRIPCYQTLGMREDALQAFDQAEVLNSENADAHFFIGSFHYEQSEIDLAIKHLERAIWLDVTYPNARNMLANCHRTKKDNEKAKECFEEQLYYEEDDEESLIGLAQILLEEGDLARTEPLIEHAGELDPENPQVDQLRAFLSYRKGEIEAAVRHLHQAVKKDPQDVNAWWNLANVFHEMGRIRKARRAFERAVALAPSKSDLLFEFVEFLFDSNKSEDAAAPLQRLSEASPNDPTYLGLQGRYYAAQEKSSQAEVCYRKAMAIAPDKSVAYLLLSDLLVNKGRVRKAREVLESFLETNSPEPAVLEQLALLLLWQGQVQRALDLATSPMLGAGQKANFYQNVAWYHYQKQMFKKAVTFAQRALSYDPVRQSSMYLLAESLEHLKRQKEAVTIYLQALCYYPGEVLILKRIAGLCEKMKKTEAARRYFAAAARRDSLDTSSRSALERLRSIEQDNWFSLARFLRQIFRIP